MQSTPAVKDLEHRRPEWAPWLLLVDTARGEIGNAAWSAVVPDATPSRPPMPALSGATLVVPEKLLRRMFERLVLAAKRGGVPKMAALGDVLRGDLDLAGLFESSLTQDARRVEALAAARGVDPEALHALVTLLSVPFLHACRSQWQRPGASPWTEGYCQICGAWPAFAEVRGIERSRYYRCGRCGGEWYGQVLQCAYCRTTEHEELVALVPEQKEASGAVDACKCCRGYLKSFTRLQGSAPSAVMLDDLASVDLDVAAIGAGYKRPAGAGCPPAISVQLSTGRGILAWNG